MTNRFDFGVPFGADPPDEFVQHCQGVTPSTMFDSLQSGELTNGENKHRNTTSVPLFTTNTTSQSQHDPFAQPSSVSAFAAYLRAVSRTIASRRLCVLVSTQTVNGEFASVWLLHPMPALDIDGGSQAFSSSFSSAAAAAGTFTVHGVTNSRHDNSPYWQKMWHNYRVISSLSLFSDDTDAVANNDTDGNTASMMAHNTQSAFDPRNNHHNDVRVVEHYEVLSVIGFVVSADLRYVLFALLSTALETENLSSSSSFSSDANQTFLSSHSAAAMPFYLPLFFNLHDCNDTSCELYLSDIAQINKDGVVERNGSTIEPILSASHHSLYDFLIDIHSPYFWCTWFVVMLSCCTFGVCFVRRRH